MESNRDEAIKCLHISQRRRDSGDLTGARKFALKSISLFSTPEASKLLQSIDELIASEASSANGSTFASGTDADAHTSPSGSRHRHTHATSSSSKESTAMPNGTASGSGGEKRDYTPDQAAIVKRIQSCKVTEYYEILSVKKDCGEAEIKKAYRKVRCVFADHINPCSRRLLFSLHCSYILIRTAHPVLTKRSKVGLSVVTCAFTPVADRDILHSGIKSIPDPFRCADQIFHAMSYILKPHSPSDPQKRAVFDQHGSDPDSRFSGMSSAREGFASAPFGGGSFEGELSPEDLFNMFFGGGGMGQMGGGPFGFGGPGGASRTSLF
jgi:DnaJ family protein B protein 12